MVIKFKFIEIILFFSLIHTKFGCQLRHKQREQNNMKLDRRTKIEISNIAHEPVKLLELLESIQDIKDNKKGTNSYYLNKMVNYLKFGGKLPFRMFTVGNSKLPFLSYSALPGVTCPGSKECLNYCYSFKAWRYPASFFRQVQNTLLINNFKIIQDELIKTIQFFPKLRNSSKIDFRLFVDGDFKDIDNLKNWLNLISNNKKLRAYGYSKSLNLFVSLFDQGFNFPTNYVLNLSNGGKFDLFKKILQPLKFVRGNFTALKGSLKEIRGKFENKIFICPGNCGNCTSKGHACGNLDIFKNVEIVIPIH
jgi:hypothetical protein